MKIIRLYLKDHLLLHDLDIRFNRSGRLDEKENYRLDFLVGVNGSGKSTLLRTLVEIFASLQTGQGAEYEYFLEYELAKKDQTVKVFIDKHWNKENKVWHIVTTAITSEGETKEFYNSVLESQYLPDRVVVYTTGSEEEWINLLADSFRYTFSPDAPQEVLNNPLDRSIFELPIPSGDSEGQNIFTQGELPFVFIRGSRLNTITLCGLLRYITEPENLFNTPLSKVLEAIGIEEFTGFSLCFRIYDRLSPKTTYEEILSIQPYEIRHASDRLIPFDLTDNSNQAKALLEKTNGAFGLFQLLDSLQENGPTGEPTLQPPSIFLQRKDSKVTDDKGNTGDKIPSVFLLDWLSDGERAFLGRMALLTMLDLDNSLIILDEPEVHFNDYWKREVVNLLDGMMHDHTNHVLITTHSSILLSDVTEGQITVFVKNTSGITEQRRPGIKTFGADPSEIMMVTFDTELSSGAKSEEELVAAIQNGDREKVSGLLEMIGPGMWRFRLKQRLEEIDAASTKSS